MLNAVQQNKLILASASPRRKHLLQQAGLVFDILPSHFDENSVALGKPTDYVTTLACAKAEEISRQNPSHWVIGADTIVLIHGTVLGKPDSQNAARDMLKRLSGQTHQVYTGFALYCARLEKRITGVVCTDVTFKQLSENEIEWYTHTDEPFDKAGAYAIQGLGTFLVRSISGSYTNVVGLPVCEVMEILLKEGVIQITNGTGHET